MIPKFSKNKVALYVALAMGSISNYTYAEENEIALKDVERIAVIGSRSAPRSVADSPVPIDIIGGDELDKNASSDMLNMLVGAIPSFNVISQPAGDAASLVRPVNLRGLSSDSTLILVNGKRRHRSSVITFIGGGANDGAQGPDLSVIPSIAIKQVEVLRDGAAAQYGSDAIAGVMNFALKDDADGASLSVRQAGYYEGDGASTIIDGNIGMPFTKDGFANVSFQYKNADATSRSVQRPDAQALIDAGNSAVPDPAQVWGNPEINDDITVFVNIGLDLDDDNQFYLFGNYSERDVSGGFFYRSPQDRDAVYTNNNGELLIGDIGESQGAVRSCGVVSANVANVLDTDAYQQMVADPNCFAMNQIFPGGYTPSFGGNITDTSLTMGTKGEIKSGLLASWEYDVSGSVGRSESAYNLKNTLNPSLGLATPVDFETGKYIQLEKTFSAELVKGVDMGLEDLVNIATGIEWREESFEIVAGEEASWQAGAFADQGFSIGAHGFKGFGPEAQSHNSRRSFATYLDMEAYLTEDFLLGGAIRYEDFTTFGSTLNYKLTAQYSLTEELSLRASHSTGFRAPTVGQANVVNTATSMVNGKPIQTFLAPPTDPLAAFYGAKELNPEESISFAFGGVYQAGDLFLTLDYYTIEVEGRLSQSSVADILVEDHQALRDSGVKNPELISGVSYFTNDFDTTTQGIDIVANYSAALMGGSTLYSFAYNWNETTVDSFNPETTSEGKIHLLEKGLPEHRATFTISQTWDDVSMFVRSNYFGEYFATHVGDTCSVGCWNETADSAITIDAEASYFVNNSVTVSVGVNNILDQKAQQLPEDSYGVLGAKYYETGPFDFNGGYYYAKLTYNF